ATAQHHARQLRMQRRLTAREADAEGAERAQLPEALLEDVGGHGRARAIVFVAVAAGEVAAARDDEVGHERAVADALEETRLHHGRARLLPSCTSAGSATSAATRQHTSPRSAKSPNERSARLCDRSSEL